MHYRLLLIACFHLTGALCKENLSATADPLPVSVIRDAKKFCAEKGYSTSICFLIDLSKPSGMSRFFVYDFHRSIISKAGLVTHGGCNKPYLSTVSYSNKSGSGCSSYGKYRVGNFYKGIFGDSYRLYGLDSSNSMAFDRSIVLHSHRCIPDKEVYPDQICNSQGCTTVSPAFLQELKSLIIKEKNPILLWVIQ